MAIRLEHMMTITWINQLWCYMFFLLSFEISFNIFFPHPFMSCVRGAMWLSCGRYLFLGCGTCVWTCIFEKCGILKTILHQHGIVSGRLSLTTEVPSDAVWYFPYEKSTVMFCKNWILNHLISFYINSLLHIHYRIKYLREFVYANNLFLL